MRGEVDSERFATWQCIRSLLLLFNVAFWVSGLSIVWIGIWMQTDFQYYLKISDGYSIHTPHLLIAVGTVILFGTTLACSCIVKVQPSLLAFYSCFLVTMMFVLIFLSAYVHTYKEQLVSGFARGIHSEIENHDLNTIIPRETPIEFIQKNLDCCGSDSHLDWADRRLPKSCCWNADHTNGCDITYARELLKEGCFFKLRGLINTYLMDVVTIISAVALFPLFGAVCAFILALSTNRTSYERIV